MPDLPPPLLRSSVRSRTFRPSCSTIWPPRSGGGGAAMERETLLGIMAAALFGAAVWAAALVARAGVDAEADERLAWRRLVGPVFAGVCVLAFLIGWAMQEPDPSDERAGIALVALALAGSAIM